MGALTIALNPLFIDDCPGKASRVVALKPRDFSRKCVRRREQKETGNKKWQKERKDACACNAGDLALNLPA